LIQGEIFLVLIFFFLISIIFEHLSPITKKTPPDVVLNKIEEKKRLKKKKVEEKKIEEKKIEEKNEEKKELSKEEKRIQ